MSAPDPINEVAAVIDSTWTFEADDDEHPAREIAQALAEAGWLRTAEDRAGSERIVQEAKEAQRTAIYGDTLATNAYVQGLLRAAQLIGGEHE